MMDRCQRTHGMSSPMVSKIKPPLPQKIIPLGPVELKRQSSLKIQTYVGKVIREGRRYEGILVRGIKDLPVSIDRSQPCGQVFIQELVSFRAVGHFFLR